MTRAEVYAVIDGERAYQDGRWGGTVHDENKRLGDWITYMRFYLDEATRRATKDSHERGALTELRKVVALGVACFEQMGVPERSTE
jgi:hypothetical protein